MDEQEARTHIANLIRRQSTDAAVPKWIILTTFEVEQAIYRNVTKKNERLCPDCHGPMRKAPIITDDEAYRCLGCKLTVITYRR